MVSSWSNSLSPTKRTTKRRPVTRLISAKVARCRWRVGGHVERVVRKFSDHHDAEPASERERQHRAKGLGALVAIDGQFRDVVFSRRASLRPRWPSPRRPASR